MRMKRVCGRHFLLVLACAVIFAMAASPAGCSQPDYDGTYAGTYTGNDDGFWVAVAPGSSSAAVFLSYSTIDDIGDGGYLSFGGETASVGNFRTSFTELRGSSVDADVDSSSGSVTGVWSNSGDSGTLTGGKVSSCPQAGSYSGTFGGDDIGTWSLTIDANCHITGSMASSTSTNSGSFEGGCHPNGHALMVGAASTGDNFGVFGTISGSSFSGTWAADTGDSGTITSGSSSGGSSSGSSGGGGGAGCFILSLLGD